MIAFQTMKVPNIYLSMSQFDADASSRESTRAEMEMKSRKTKPMRSRTSLSVA